MYKSLNSINPYTGNTLETYVQHSDEEVSRRLKKSESAFGEWREASVEARAELMTALAKALEADKQGLAELATAEMGKPLEQGVAEVEKCAWLCKHYAENTSIYLKDNIIHTDAKDSRVAYEPLGPILGVMPWNFPFWQVMRFIVPTLMAGNTALVKHASNTQGCAEQTEKMLAKAGFPDGVFQVLRVSGKRVAGIIKADAVKAVSLTGSEKAGASVASAAGESLKKAVLELGGSNAFIVLADADPDAAAETAVRARVQNNGQSCIAAKRFLVDGDIYDDFLEAFKSKWEDLSTGDPMDSKTDVGPLARADLAEKLEQQMRDSIAQGAVLLGGGQRREAMFQPAILTEVGPGMPAFDEETFGPLAAFTRVGGLREAIALNNRSRYGLGATIYTADVPAAMDAAKDIADGAVFFNELVKSDPRLPFGGTKISGYGRELGPLGIKEFVNAKTYYVR